MDTVKDEVAKVALPPLTVPVPMVTEPFLNVTVPVGVPEPEDVIVAVKFTVWPYSDGFAEDVSVVVVELIISSVSGEEVLPVK